MESFVDNNSASRIKWDTNFLKQTTRKIQLPQKRAYIDCLYSNVKSFARLIADTYYNNFYIVLFNVAHNHLYGDATLYLATTESHRLSTLHGRTTPRATCACRKEKECSKIMTTSGRVSRHAEKFHLTTNGLTSNPNRVVYGLLPTQTKRTSPSSCGIRHELSALQEDNNNKHR